MHRRNFIKNTGTISGDSPPAPLCFAKRGAHRHQTADCEKTKKKVITIVLMNSYSTHYPNTFVICSSFFTV